MKLIFAGSLSLAMALCAVPASAQVFEGPYVGLQAGWNHDKIGNASSDIGNLDIHDSRDSFTGGVYGGYNHQVAPNVVLGVEAGFNLGADDAVRGNAAVIDPNYSFDLGARAGYLVNDKTLAYVRGGYENTRARIASAAGNSHDTFDGWSIGGGVERALTDTISARLEYRYSDLGSDNGSFDRHQALVGVAYHF